MLEPLSLAAGLSWGSGLRLYLTVLVAGVFERVGLIHLPDTLSVLASPWVIGAAAVLTVANSSPTRFPPSIRSGTRSTRSSAFRPVPCWPPARSVMPIRRS